MKPKERRKSIYENMASKAARDLAHTYHKGASEKRMREAATRGGEVSKYYTAMV